MTRRTRNWCGGFSFAGNGQRTNVRASAMKSFAELTGREKTIETLRWIAVLSVAVLRRIPCLEDCWKCEVTDVDRAGDCESRKRTASRGSACACRSQNRAAFPFRGGRRPGRALDHRVRRSPRGPAGETRPVELA